MIGEKSRGGRGEGEDHICEDLPQKKGGGKGCIGLLRKIFGTDYSFLSLSLSLFLDLPPPPPLPTLR